MTRAGVGWVVLGMLFRFYIDTFGKYEKTYGTVGGVTIILLFFYIDALVMQNNNDWLGGYVRWFTGTPANNAYPRSVLFARGGLLGAGERAWHRWKARS